LAERGFDVAILDVARDEDAEETLTGLKERGARAVFVEADISRLEDHQRVLDSVWGQLGPLSCLVNNAGVQTRARGDMLDVTRESFDRLIDINLRGTFFLTQAVARKMIADDAGDPARPNRSIIILSTANAVIASIDKAEYCISKSALTMTSSLFAARLAPHGITVNELRPGIVHTEMTKDVFDKFEALIQSGAIPQHRWGRPEDIGQTVAAIASGLLPYATGQAFHVDGGLHIRRA
jgi:NAD(P)-dependent dehydrogenase (short-subunit alcohol dehydrogenase family)